MFEVGHFGDAQKQLELIPRSLGLTSLEEDNAEAQRTRRLAETERKPKAFYSHTVKAWPDECRVRWHLDRGALTNHERCDAGTRYVEILILGAVANADRADALACGYERKAAAHRRLMRATGDRQAERHQHG
jgi:hypothetical protein